MKIIAETIERELKQTGFNYDQSYKTAAMAWELEKQTLMTAWNAELQGIKRGEAAAEATLDLLAIEVSRRAIALTEAKTAIDLAMEAYKKTLAGLEGDVSPYEVQLANGKLLTAQKKLEILPIIEQILTKEQELLIIEQSKAAEYTKLIAAENAVSAKKETLTPFVNALATKAEEYAAKITAEQIPTEEQIADEKIAQATAAVAKAGYQVRELTAEIETETKKLELMGEKRTLADAEFVNEQELVSHEKELTETFQNAAKADFTEGLEDDRSTMTKIIDDKTTVETIRNSTKLTSENTLANGEKSAASRITAYQIDEMQKVADVKATAAELTAELKHLIG